MVAAAAAAVTVDATAGNQGPALLDLKRKGATHGLPLFCFAAVGKRLRKSIVNLY
jgi:hypothetical protein